MKSHDRFVLAPAFLSALTLTLASCGGSASNPMPTALAYVASAQSQAVKVIDIPANKTVTTIPLKNASNRTYPQTVVLTPDGSRAYVPDGVTGVWVIDTLANAVLTSIPVTQPERITISPDGRRVYATTINGVVVIDTVSNTVVANVNLGAPPSVYTSGVAVSGDSTHVFVGNANANNIWVIDASSNTVVSNITTMDAGNFTLAASPDGTQVYAGGYIAPSQGGGGAIDIIDIATSTVTKEITLGLSSASNITFSPDGSRFIAVTTGGDLNVFDATTGSSIFAGNLTREGGLFGLALTPNGSQAYVTGGPNSLYVVDMKTFAVSSTIDESKFPPLGLAIMAARNNAR